MLVSQMLASGLETTMLEGNVGSQEELEEKVVVRSLLLGSAA
jgi:hypothetical protein